MHNSLVKGPIEALFVPMPAVFEGLHDDMQFVITRSTQQNPSNSKKADCILNMNIL